MHVDLAVSFCRDAWPREAAIERQIDGDWAGWSLPPDLAQAVISADRACIDSLGDGAHVMPLPPRQALLTVSSAEQLPFRCCHQLQAPQPSHKVAAGLWHLVSHVSTASENDRCEPHTQVSHKCALRHPDQPDLIAFEVHLVQAQHLTPNMSASIAAMKNSATAAAAAEVWQKALHDHVEGSPIAMHPEGDALIVYAPARYLAKAVLAVAQQPEVLNVQPRRMHFLHNLQDISVQIQAGDPAQGQGSATEAQFWAAGVNGTGQVIGVGDSGIDMQHCAFVDPVVPFDSFTVDRSRVPQFRSEQHRKLALYYMYAQGVLPSHSHLYEAI